MNELDSIKREMFNEGEKTFLNAFDEQWRGLIDRLYYHQIQLQIGNRIRPRLVYWGYSAGCLVKDKAQMEMPVKVAVVMELIHKASILLDDYIDGDQTRRGMPAFHYEYGDKKTILFSLNLIGHALQTLNDILNRKDISFEDYRHLLQTLASTMEDMSLGVLQELDLDEKTQFELDRIKGIIDKETSALLSNSLLFGYYASGHHPIDALAHIELIGRKCGYLFQTMNDLEPMCQAEKNIEYKGHLNTDFASKRKNIAVAFLYPQLDTIDRERLIGAQERHDDEQIIKLIKEYDITRQILAQMDLVYQDILLMIYQAVCFDISAEWQNGFTGLISRLYYLCLERLNN